MNARRQRFRFGLYLPLNIRAPSDTQFERVGNSNNNSSEERMNINSIVNNKEELKMKKQRETNNNNNSSSKTSYTNEEWDSKCNEISLSKGQLNELVMNYLITYGYQQTAMRFCQEADVKNQIELNTLGQRREIMKLIHDGQIQQAIEKINDVDPELLDTNTSLHFALLRLQLIELIRTSLQNGDNTFENVQPAIDFATNNLASRAPSNPKFLADLEKTMALLCFPPNSNIPQLQELMDYKLRKQIAQEVNEALMSIQGLSGDTKLHKLIHLWGYGEKQLGEKVEFPRLTRDQLF